MAYPTSNYWYLLTSTSTNNSVSYFTLSNGDGALGMLEEVNTTSDWQILFVDNVYYFRNRGLGPGYQLSFTNTNTGPTPILAVANTSDVDQQWSLRPYGDRFGILGSGGLALSPFAPFLGEWGNDQMLWSLDSVGLIDDSTFPTNTQISLSPSVPRSAPNPTDSSISDPPPDSHFFNVGPAVAGVALLFAFVVAFYLWRSSPRRRNKAPSQCDIELNNTNAEAPSVAPVREDPELPEYDAARADPRPEYVDATRVEQPIAAPPPLYSPRSEERPVDGVAQATPPEYAGSVVR